MFLTAKHSESTTNNMRHTRRVLVSKHVENCSCKPAHYKAVSNKRDHSIFISGDTHSGKSDNTKKQTNTICSPEAQQEIRHTN